MEVLPKTEREGRKQAEGERTKEERIDEGSGPGTGKGSQETSG